MSTEAEPLSVTGRTRLRRHKERARTDRADLYAVLDAGLICHLGVVVDGAPRVLPSTYARDGDTLYLHGSSANAGFGAGDGHEVCVTVTHFDGLVLARSVFSHSVNYRSAMVLGTAVGGGGGGSEPAARRRAPRAPGPRPGAGGGGPPPPPPGPRERAATSVLALS